MSGVIVVGLSRSGTSLVAGLFREHGVFFGDTFPPTENNPKGNLEHRWLKERIGSGIEPTWPDPWFERLRDEGWSGEPWGVKGGEHVWYRMKWAEPTVAVFCHRPAQAIADSRERAGFSAMDAWGIKASADRLRSRLRASTTPVVDVDTPAIAGGDYEALEPAFELLGLTLRPERCDAWVEPDHFAGAA